MDANGLSPKETVPASRKLSHNDARELAANATTVIVAKGKKVTTFKTTDGLCDGVADLERTAGLAVPGQLVTLIVGDLELDARHWPTGALEKLVFFGLLMLNDREKINGSSDSGADETV